MGFAVLIISYQHTSYEIQWFLVYEIRLAREMLKRCEMTLQLDAANPGDCTILIHRREHTHPRTQEVRGVLWKSVAYLLCALRSCKQDHVKTQLECFL